ncbi:hypothetical protein RSal33209_1116 [Renibacterium salmoninarum ATCC 33209]|uniref:Uncharacterized protein n=1 Tax=Renibacterium salmoninarum (strain ATCC 33209 / DSM 20767 / JCM 11484 / NBRC 15589 / NCIMB 2235) TaxID=288705 RepID=A9WP79_RENSM|nr:hypothetical protein RSal33209_1116 [Renibacterium salmoninarum ATCC 33209]
MNYRKTLNGWLSRRDKHAPAPTPQPCHIASRTPPSSKRWRLDWRPVFSALMDTDCRYGLPGCTGGTRRRYRTKLTCVCPSARATTPIKKFLSFVLARLQGIKHGSVGRLLDVPATGCTISAIRRMPEQFAESLPQKR